MPKVYGYTRGVIGEPPEKVQADQQALETEFRARFETDHVWGGFFNEVVECGCVPFSQRTAGFRLGMVLERGDVVLVGKLSHAFASLRDFSEMMQHWRVVGVRVIVLDAGLDLGTEVGQMFAALLSACGELESAHHAERIRIGQTKRAAKGLSNGRPHVGFKLVGRKGRRREVRDDYARACGAQFLKWREEGHTTVRIYHECIRQRIKDSKGKQWSLGAIQRAVEAERRFQAAEEKQAREAGESEGQAAQGDQGTSKES